MTDFDLVGELECIWEVQAICGEGPLWIEAEQSLYFVDIDGQKLHCYEETSNARRSLELEEKTGWVLPRCNHKILLPVVSPGFISWIRVPER